MTTGVVYIDHDNVVTLQLLDDCAPVNLSSMTRVAVKISAIEVDSETRPELFILDDLAAGKVGLKFGDLDTLPEGDHNIRVVVYDNANQDGLVWTHEDNIIPTTLRVIRN